MSIRKSKSLIILLLAFIVFSITSCSDDDSFNIEDHILFLSTDNGTPNDHNIYSFNKYSFELNKLFVLNAEASIYDMARYNDKLFVSVSGGSFGGQPEIWIYNLNKTTIPASKITVSEYPQHIKFNNSKLYLTASGNPYTNLIAVYDPITMTNTKNIEIGYNPAYMLKDDSRLIVICQGDNSVYIIDTINDEVITNYQTFNNPQSCAVDDNNNLYIACAGDYTNFITWQQETGKITIISDYYNPSSTITTIDAPEFAHPQSITKINSTIALSHSYQAGFYTFTTSGYGSIITGLNDIYAQYNTRISCSFNDKYIIGTSSSNFIIVDNSLSIITNIILKNNESQSRSFCQ